MGLASLAHAGCAADVCGQRCGAAGECPSGFACGGQGYCVPEDDRAACGEPDGPVSSPEPPVAGGAPGFAGSSGSGGLDAAGGSGLVPVSAPAALAIDVRAPADSCASDDVDIELTASGGDGTAYHWTVVDPTGTFTGLEGTGSRWLLSGAPAAAGPLELEVELSDGTTSVTESIALVVHARPRLVTDAVPALCPGERVALPLAAEGGDASSYEYSVEIDPALGLALDGASLSGRFAPTGGVPSSVVLSVRDAYCAGVPRELSLEVLPAGSESCPQIQVAGAGATLDTLPPPCLGSDYEQAIVAQPDTPAGYTWREVATAPGLHFDASDGVVRGTPLGAGTITLQVSDERGRTIEADFPVTPRQHCWLAYLAAPDGPQRLHLFDPRLPEQPTARRAFPDAGAAGDVLDFAFSPRGRFLVYRVALDGEPNALRLLDLWSWREHALEFAGSVGGYAWSEPDAAAEALAVTFETGAEQQLGGLLLSSASDALGADGQGGADLSPLAPNDIVYYEPAPAAVLSGLAWFDGAHIAFLAPDPIFEPGRLFQWARVDAGVVSLEPARERLEFFDGARFQPAPGGVFVIDTSTGQPHFYASDGAEVDHRIGILLSPSGAFTARAVGGELRVFRVTDRSVLETDPAWARADGCSAVLAWARGRERIACAAAAEGNQRVAFFDLSDPERPELVPLDRVLGDYRFLTGEHIGQARVFSDGGGRFAFSTGEDIHVVQLDDGAPRIEVSTPLSLVSLAPSPLQLSFSAEARLLSAHAGDGLAAWSLDTEAPFARLPVVLPEPSACSENPFDAAPWCGAEADARVARWSAGEDALVYRTAAGELEVHVFARADAGAARAVAVEPGCGDGCIVPGTYTFQP